VEQQFVINRRKLRKILLLWMCCFPIINQMVSLNGFSNGLKIVESASAPQIVQQPEDAEVPVGGTGRFRVVALGEELLYQWRFNGVRILGATNSDLVWSSVTAGDVGDYLVDVTNSGGTTRSAVAKLTIFGDSDGDGISEADEISVYHTGAYKQDSDGDGLSDGAELFRYKTNPNQADTDEDGYTDREEVESGRDPLSSSDQPVPELGIYSAVEVTIATLSGKDYRLEESSDLKTWQTTVEHIAGDGRLFSHFARALPGHSRFFRAVVRTAPTSLQGHKLHFNIRTGTFAGSTYDEDFTASAFSVSNGSEASGNYTYAPTGNKAALHQDYTAPAASNGDFDKFNMSWTSTTAGAFSGTSKTGGVEIPASGIFIVVQ
jgi:hypothetical protein